MALLSEPLTESSIKILFFSGKPDDYLVWKSKQLAKAGRYGYLDLILGNTSLPTDAERLTAKAVDEDKRTKPQLEILENWKLGCRGYEDLILAMNTTDPQGMVAWSLVERAKTPENKQGDVKLAFDQLEIKYAPPTAPNYMKLGREFINAVFTPPTSDPDMFIRSLEDLALRMNTIKIDGKSDKTETDVILAILAKLPQDLYAIEIHQVETNLANKVKVTIESLRTELRTGYARIMAQQDGKGGVDEQALAAIRQDYTDAELVAFVRGNFKGNCNRCGKQGHKGVNCPDNGNGGGGNGNGGDGNSGGGGNGQKRRRPNISCHYCGFRGHKENECRKKKAAELAKSAMETETGNDGSYEGDNESYDELGFTAAELADYSSSAVENDSDHEKDLKNEFSDKRPDQVKQEFDADTLSLQMSIPQDLFYDSEVSDITYEPEAKRVRFEPYASVHSYYNDIEEHEDDYYKSAVPQDFSHDTKLRLNFKNASPLPIYRYGYPLSIQCKSLLPGTTESSAEYNYDVAYAEGTHRSNDPDVYENRNHGTYGSHKKGTSRDEDGITSYLPFTHDTWIGDSGSSCHLDNDDSGMYDVQMINDRIGMIDAKSSVRAVKMGRKRYIFRQIDGTETIRELYPVKYAPTVVQKLLSLTRELETGATLRSDTKTNNIELTYADKKVIVLDRRYKTKHGWVSGVEMLPIVETANMAHTLTKQKPVSIVLYHEQVGHPNMVVTRSTATSRGVKLVGTMQTCKSCAIAKAHQKNVPKVTTTATATKPGWRLALDISSPTTKSIGGSKHWLLVHDDCTAASFSFLLKTKDQLQAVMIPWLKTLEAAFSLHVTYIRCDNAGENLAFEKASKREGMGLKFEYTAPGTPQQNGRAERKFQTLYGRVRAMLIGSGIQQPLRNSFWAEAVNTATELDGILVAQGQKMSPYQKFFGKGYKSIIDVTKTFGEECIVADRTGIKNKLADRGKPCLWMGYARDHSAGTFRLYNPATRKMFLSRDVIFLGETSKEVEIEENDQTMELTPTTDLALRDGNYDQDDVDDDEPEKPPNSIG